MVGMSSNPASELAQLLEPSLHSFKAIADLALEEQRPLSDYVAQGVDFAWHVLAAPALLEQVVRYLTEQRNLTPTADNERYLRQVLADTVKQLPGYRLIQSQSPQLVALLGDFFYTTLTQQRTLAALARKEACATLAQQAVDYLCEVRGLSLSPQHVAEAERMIDQICTRIGVDVPTLDTDPVLVESLIGLLSRSLLAQQSGNA